MYINIYIDNYAQNFRFAVASKGKFHASIFFPSFLFTGRATSSFKGPLALFKGMLFSFAKVRGNLATNKQQNALR